MKKILITKLASMGDLIHLLPALSDAKKAFPEISFDWLVDKSFQEIPLWNPSVSKAIITNHRVWRKSPLSKKTRDEFKHVLSEVKKTPYDLIIDAQGGLKSALLSCFAKGKRGGFDGASVKEWGAHFFYHHKCRVPKELHAIERLRALFGKLLNYRVEGPPLYDLSKEALSAPKDLALPENFFVFVPIASHDSKLWPEEHWKALATLMKDLNLPILIPSGSEKEMARAERLSTIKGVKALPKLSLGEVGYILQRAKGVVSVDTGLSHMSAALGIPSVTLYGPTNPRITGTIGKNQLWIENPSLSKISPEEVFTLLTKDRYNHQLRSSVN